VFGGSRGFLCAHWWTGLGQLTTKPTNRGPLMGLRARPKSSVYGLSLPFDGSCSQARGRSVWKREAREEQAGEGDGASSVRGYPGDLSNHKARIVGTGESRSSFPSRWQQAELKCFHHCLRAPPVLGEKSDVLTCLPGRTIAVSL
jgi:hypothetical protein